MSDSRLGHCAITMSMCPACPTTYSFHCIHDTVPIKLHHAYIDKSTKKWMFDLHVCVYNHDNSVNTQYEFYNYRLIKFLCI